MLTFWGGPSSQNSGSEYGKLVYALINVGLVFLGAMLARRAFVVFGALGVMGYLSYQVFKDSLLFTFVLGGLGLGIVLVGIWWSKREDGLYRALSRLLPASLRRAIAARA